MGYHKGFKIKVFLNQRKIKKYFRLTTSNTSTIWTAGLDKMAGLDSQMCTGGDVRKNQSQMMKLIRNFMLSWLNWIQDLE